MRHDRHADSNGQMAFPGPWLARKDNGGTIGVMALELVGEFLCNAQAIRLLLAAGIEEQEIPLLLDELRYSLDGIL